MDERERLAQALLSYAGVQPFADLSQNHAAASPTQPTAGDYVQDALAALGVPREQAAKLGGAFGLVPETVRESGRALATPVADPSAGNVARAGGEAALWALPFGVGKAARMIGRAITPSRDEVMAKALHRADPWGAAAYPDLGVNWQQLLQPAAKAGKLEHDPFLSIANDRRLGTLK